MYNPEAMRVIAGLLVALFGAVSQASAPVEADEMLAQLSKIRLDKKQVHNIRDITIRRDALSISFTRGTIAFFESVAGKVTGAVFIGEGEVVAIPPDAIEKQQIYRFTGSPILNETFRSGFFRFTDNTYEEILKERSEHAEEEVSEDDSAQFAPWEQVLTERSGVLNYRILADLLSAGSHPLFLAELNGEKHGWFDVVFDPRLTEEVVIFKQKENGTDVRTEVWASFNRRGETKDLEAASPKNKSSADITSYDIDAVISADNQLDATATMHLKALIEGERVLSFDLPSSMRASSVSVGQDTPVPFYTGLVVVLPQPVHIGEEITLRVAYSGRFDSTALWYPNLGPLDRAPAVVTFHYPPSFNLVATGDRVKEWEENGLRHSIWKSSGELPIMLSARESFGNVVVARTYHDEWMIEGLSRYMAAISQDKQPQMPNITEDGAGPVWLGPRIGNNELLSKKAMWILHMLRMLMRGDGDNPDETFLKMTQEFIQDHRDSAASTLDLKRTAEKYMTKVMDLRGDKKLDWFFDEWVMGTGIPSYKLDYQIDDANDGFVISGSVKQSGVPDHFVMPVPVYADEEFLGRVVVDDEGSFRFVVKKRPGKILVDPYRTILSVQ